MPAIQIIDDEEAIAWALRRAFEREGYRVGVSASAEDGLKQVAAKPPDAIFLDVRLPGMDGLTALAKLQALAPAARIVIMTAHGNLSTAVKAVAGGAFDYLAKPFDLAQALDVAKRAVQKAVPAAPQVASAEEIVGHSPAMQTVFKRIALVAPTTACVLITGESGTGKELVARAVHAHSARSGKPFVPVHVAALNPNLVESELFGHVRGAFTGADKPRAGLLQLADGGTVFLDELADIPRPVQAKLLRVLERQEVLPVGTADPVRVDLRIVSATHANLSEAVAKGTFRHDLFYRLNVYPIHIPPLRDRPDDVAELAAHFLRQFAPRASLPPETLDVLRNRSWPGNVRELRNALEHAAIVSRGGAILPEHVPAPALAGPANLHERMQELVRQWVGEQAAGAEPVDLHQKLLDDLEPALVAEVLTRLGGNRLAAGRWLGLARATVRKMIRKYGIDPNEPDDDV